MFLPISINTLISIYLFLHLRFLQLGDDAKKSKRKYGNVSRAARRHVENDEEEEENERDEESNDDSSGGGKAK